MCRIQVVEFRDLQIWSAALQNAKPITSKFNLVRLDEVLVDLTKTRAFVIKDDEFYKEPTISSKTNLITPRKEGFGREFKVKKRVLILPNDLVVAKMHTQNGLYAFAKETFASTNTFVPFEIKENKINRDFLFIVLKPTLQRLQKFDSVNRETYTTDEILNLQIPLPPLEKQREIVASLQDLQDKIAAKEAEQSALKERIESHIYGALGLQKQSQAPKQKVFVVNFKDLERWDTSFNQTHAINVKSQNLAEITAPKFSLVKLGEMCGFRRGPFGGSLKKEIFVNQGYKVYEQQHAIKNNFEIGRYFISKDKFEEMRNFEVLPNDLIMSCSGTIGKIAIAPENIQKGIINQALLRLRILNFQSVRVDFLKIVLEYVLNDTFQQNSYGSAIKNITSVDTLKNLQIPLPPLEIQRKIVQEIENLQSQISALNDEIAKHENAKQTLTHDLLW